IIKSRGEHMKYIIKERILTLTDKFIIEDEEGYSRYEVVGKLLSLGNKLCIYDLDGEELVYIEQKLFKLLPEYNIYQKGHLVGKVKKKITFLKPSFIIESSYGNFTLKGDILHHDFDILKDGKSVAWINKKWLSFSDTYSVEISDLVDHAF